MWITNYKKKCVEIEDVVFRNLLSFYPEERLILRPKFAEAVNEDSISFTDIKSEAETLFIPWQMFFLEKKKLETQLKNIEANRADKIALSFLSKRSGKSGAFSLRLVDRFIRMQNFLVSNGSFPDNGFNKSLVGLDINGAVERIRSHFDIDMGTFRRQPKIALSIDYLIDCISKGNINVARGTTSHGLMPSTKNHMVLYKNMSGFCLKDEKVPFIYLSTNEVVGEEPVGRQIYTLIYLLTLIGLDIYSFAVNAKTIVRVPNGDARTQLANAITSELLIPKKELQTYGGKKISWDDVKDASLKFKVTPRAVLFRMKKDGLVKAYEHDLLLKSNPYVPTTQKMKGGPKVDTSVKKLGGSLVFNFVNAQTTMGDLKPVQAQIILFGKPDSIKWRGYIERVGIRL